MSNIHHVLHLLARYPSSHIPGDKKYHFQLRAGRILDKWTPLLCNDLPNRHWGLTSHYSMLYMNDGKHLAKNYLILTHQ